MAIATEATAGSSSSKGMPVEEYLRTSFDPDCEYVDGEVLDRNVGEKGHSKVQWRLIVWFAKHGQALGVFALQEWRFKVTDRHYRIPDFCIVAGPEPDEAVLNTRPLVCVEILSPEDRMSRMSKKIADYLAYGVRYVWILNPKTREAIVYTEGDVHPVTDGMLRTENPAIEIPLSEIFE
jgi:Uma2 family endonuclease